MDRGAKPAKAKVEARTPVAKESRTTDSAKVRSLETHLAEVLEQQAAMGEVLTVISRSMFDLQPVFDMVVERAVRLCAAKRAFVYRLDGDVLRMAAAHGASSELKEFAERNPIAPGRHTAVARAALERRIVHISDVRSDPEYTWGAARVDPIRTVLAVPILTPAHLLGVIVIYRLEVAPFTEVQVALMRAFADQAAIAIENARLGNELKVRNSDLSLALEREKATGEILRVIAASPSEVQPVLEAVARRAADLCQSPFARVLLVDGDVLNTRADYSIDGEAPIPTIPVAVKRTSVTGRAVLDNAIIHHADIVPLLDTEFPDARENARLTGFRAVLAVPLLREAGAYGAIFLWRREPGLFSPDQVALMQTFARQAAIAIDNVRLFKETKEALDQQTATGEILRAISRSPTDVKPVFETIAANALRLCDATFSVCYRFDGELIHVAALHHMRPEGIAAFHATYPCPPSRGGITQRAILTGSPVHVADVRQDPEYVYHDAAKHADYRSVLAVPMLRKGRPIGAISVFRDVPRPFPETQVALLKTFADQAVIAVENVHLFTELDKRNRDLAEALEQQTATGEILRAISSSPTEIQPVLEAVVHAAARFCGAPDVVIMRIEGAILRGAAAIGQFADALRHGVGSVDALRIPLTAESVSGRAAIERRTVHVHDLAAEREDEYPMGRELQRRFGHRTMVATPLLREGAPIGVIGLFRLEVEPFSDKQVELLKTFADQAVIAIENVRLFTELEARNRDVTEALEQQTATSEILRVISRSPTDVQPVFDTIAAAALKLCSAGSGNVFTFDGELVQLAAIATPTAQGADAIRAIYPRRAGADTGSTRAIATRRVVVIQDVLEDKEYLGGERAIAGGFRSILAVPLLRESLPIGAITVGRPEPGPFPDEQISLLQTFADQAVIAIQNVRLFTELEARNRDITEALEQQTSTSEILRVISSSPTDVQPVFNIIGESAEKLCDAEISVVSRVDGELIRLAAIHGVNEEGTHAVGAHFPMRLDDETVTARTVRGRAVVHVADVMADPLYKAKDAALAGGYRGCLAVPMLRESQVIGAIFVARGLPGHFADSQVELLKTFADQAVIAIENVRLFKELEARTTELTQSVGELKALGEVGQAVSSTLDLATVLSTIVSRATQLTGMDGGAIYEYDEAREEFHLQTTDRLPAELVAALRAAPMRKGEGAIGKLAITGLPVEIRDIADEGAYRSRIRKILVRLGYRSLLAIPLLREDRLLGGLVVNRTSAGAFAPDVIDLLKTFATQSALAIQNARLFREIGDKSRQLEIASQHKSEFLANMSHELRTPLNAIIGFSEVLAERMFGEINDKQAEYLADILESGRHLLSLINDILDLSKIEAGRMELDLADFDLPGAMDNTLTLVRERAHRRGITLGHTIDEHVGKIRGDERKVKQVLLNLLSNALKFTPEGGRIDVRAVARDDMYQISVTDTGVGIAPADLEGVFEEFRQVGAAAKKVEGTGLGLAISRKFIELHGGRIWATSQVGAGSTFAFTLPRTTPHSRSSD